MLVGCRTIVGIAGVGTVQDCRSNETIAMEVRGRSDAGSPIGLVSEASACTVQPCLCWLADVVHNLMHSQHRHRAHSRRSTVVERHTRYRNVHVQ